MSMSNAVALTASHWSGYIELKELVVPVRYLDGSRQLRPVVSEDVAMSINKLTLDSSFHSFNVNNTLSFQCLLKIFQRVQ